MSPSRAAWRGAAAIGGAALTATATAAGAVAVAYARQVVTPQRHRPEDVEVLAVGPDHVVLRADETTRAPGRYSLTAGGRDAGATGAHTWAQVGDVVEPRTTTARTPRGRTVTRALLGVQGAPLRPGPASWSGWFYHGDPARALGFAFQDVVVRSDVGALPTWFVPADRGEDAERGAGPALERPGGTWAVLVHGRGATREECLRALPVLHRLGVPSLVAAYRNDEAGPASPAGRYGLGDTEWVDVEAAVLHALSAGAAHVVLLAWSMGGAIALSFLARSWVADRVRALVLDAPVIDWRDVLDHQARLHHLPRPIARLGLAALGSPIARSAVGVDGPLDLRRMDWVRRADELHTPVLLIHSRDDEFVPFAPSAALAAARPDLVRLVAFAGAAHCHEWNVDPDRWDREVARFLLDHM